MEKEKDLRVQEAEKKLRAERASYDFPGDVEYDDIPEEEQKATISKTALIGRLIFTRQHVEAGEKWLKDVQKALFERQKELCKVEIQIKNLYPSLWKKVKDENVENIAKILEKK